MEWFDIDKNYMGYAIFSDIVNSMRVYEGKEDCKSDVFVPKCSPNTIKFNFNLTLTNEGSATQVRLQPYRIALKIMYKKRFPIFQLAPSGILSGFQCFAF